jgi:hypothetical protein
MLSLEHVSQVRTAPRALDLDPHPVRVGQPLDSPRDLLVKARPSAPGIELALGPVQRGSASLALVRPRRGEVLVLSRVRAFGSLPYDDPLLFTRQLSPMGRVGGRHGHGKWIGLFTSPGEGGRGRPYFSSSRSK